jgi:hypothetical protein
MQKIRFFNSGLNHSPCFYQQFNTDILLNNRKCAEHVIYNYDLMKTRYSDVELECVEEEELKRMILRDCLNDIDIYDTLFAPLIYDEEIALDCGLIPFRLKLENDIKFPLLAMGECGFKFNKEDNLLVKLDAYQVLADNSIDHHSAFLRCRFVNEDINKRVLGDVVYNRVIETINNEVIW